MLFNVADLFFKQFSELIHWKGAFKSKTSDQGNAFSSFCENLSNFSKFTSSQGKIVP